MLPRYQSTGGISSRGIARERDHQHIASLAAASTMNPSFVPGLQQSTIAAGCAATWRFARTTTLVVVRGRVWITLAEARPCLDAPRGGDWFLDAGQSMRVTPRQAVVLEASGAVGEAATLALYSEAVFLEPARNSGRNPPPVLGSGAGRWTRRVRGALHWPASLLPLHSR